MNYINRLAEKEFIKLNKMFPVVLVCGPRQAGKTTMLKHLAENTNRTYVSLDDLDIRALAKSDPKLFFQKYKTPILIDEVQFAPNLFPYIKIMADNNQKSGEFWLTGSQSFEIMKDVSETLVGRVGIMNMYPLTYQEILGKENLVPKSFDFDTLNNITEHSNLEFHDVFSYIYNGGMPQAVDYDDDMRAEYFRSYISTYLMRDVTLLGNVSDTVRFNKFLTACASQNTNVVNYANLALASDISEVTAKDWLKLLEGIGIVYLVYPYANNSLKRLTKAPKLYFFDTGLCAFLAKIPSKEMLEVSSFAGGYFENFVMNQFMIKYALTPKHPNLYFYRDTDQNEVDILLEDFDGIVPLEVKLSANPNKRDLNKFKVLDKLGKTIKNGGIICLIDTLLPVDNKNSLIPVGLI